MRPLTCACVSLIFIATAAVLDRSPVAAQRNNHPHLYGGACGVQRWSVKTGTDSDARSVNLSRVIPTTIGHLDSLRPPASLPDRSRIGPVETAVFQVSASLIRFKQEADSDYHLVLRDDVGRTMIAEIPAPYCVGGTSPFRGHIAEARARFDSFYSVTSSMHYVRRRITVTGVGFFDYEHGQSGVAPNAIELHPVLSVQFRGKAPTRNTRSVPPPPRGPSGFSVHASVSPSSMPYGAHPTLYARTMSGATCTASVVYSTGRSPRSFDGYAQTVGRSGVVGWSWHEETRGSGGTGTVTCTYRGRSGRADASFSVG